MLSFESDILDLTKRTICPIPCATMTNQEQIDWDRIIRTAAQLGASAENRRKWKRRGVPPHWQIKIVQETKGAIRLEDFPTKPAPAQPASVA